MRICIIAAVAENGVIGRDNDLPWRLSADLRKFKQITMGKPVLMGRKTYESIGKPLPGRPNIVLSRDPAFCPEGVTVAADLDQALAAARSMAEEGGDIMVIGGEAVFRDLLPEAGRLYLTEVHCDAVGAVRFPDLQMDEWQEVAREFHKAEPGETADCSFVILDRK